MAIKCGKALISLVVATILGLSLFLIPVINRISPTQAAVTWTKSTEEVTLEDELYVVDAWVIKEDATTYKMWYTHGKPSLSLAEIASDILALNLGDIINDIASLELGDLLTDIAAIDAGDLLDFLSDASTVIGYATSSDGLVWTVQDDEVLAGSGGSAWDSVGNPSVIWDDTASEYKMWYTNSTTDLTETSLGNILTDLGDTDPDVVKAAILDLLDGTSTVIGYATSPDGDTWTPVNSEVFAGNNNILGSVGAPSVIQNSPTDYEMWYTRTKTTLSGTDLDTILADIAGFDTSDLWGVLGGISTVIGYATSPDGMDWTVVNDNVLPTSGNLLDSVADPSVIQNSPTDYEMWYTNGTTDLTVSDLPGLLLEIEALNLGALWDTLGDGLLAFLTELLALDRGPIESLLDSTNTAIGYATSEDGETWTEEEPANLVGGSGTPPWSGVAAPSVVKTGSKYEMWYTEGIETEGIDNITLLGDLMNLVLGGDLPIGYASYSPSGGGGGGGALIFTIDLTGVEVQYLISFFGGLMSTAEHTTEDGKLTIIIPGGTVILTEDGAAPIELIIAVDESPPPLPGGAVIIGTAYSFKPNGITFDPSMTLTFTYNPNSIPGNVNGEDSVIAYYDLATRQWVKLESVVDTEANTVSAEVTHLTTFALLAYAHPATFTVSGLSITPAEVDTGGRVTISVFVANTGDLTGSYEVTLKIDNEVVATREVTLAGGVSQRVSFTTTADIAGTYSVSVNGLTRSFIVKEGEIPPVESPEVPLSPAAFALSSLTISPAEIDIAGSVIISVLIANTGDLTGSYEVALKIDNVVAGTKEVTLAGGASQRVSFTTTADIAGTYSVDVSGLTGSFTVKEEVVPPVVPKEINWWLIGGIIAAVTIISVVVWQVVALRRT